MYGAIISAAAGLAGSLIGGNASRKARQRQEAILNEREKRATDLYNRDYYRDYTQTASAQRALDKARSLYNETLNRARGTQAVTGGTEESVAATKQQANNAIAETTANIAVNGEQMAQHAQDRYEAQKDAIATQRAQIEADKAKQSAMAGAQALNVGASLAGNLIDAGAQKTPKVEKETSNNTKPQYSQTPVNAASPNDIGAYEQGHYENRGVEYNPQNDPNDISNGKSEYYSNVFGLK